MITVSVLSGLGNHFGLLWGPQVVKALQYSWMGQIVAVQAIGFGKIAVIAFLLRIQERNTALKKAAWFLYFIGISNVIVNIDQMILILLQCSPSQKLWNPALPGTCDHIQRTNHVGYFQGSMCTLHRSSPPIPHASTNIDSRLSGWAAASDLALAIYPVIVFWNLKISIKIKIGLCLLMAGGFMYVFFLAAVSSVYITTDSKIQRRSSRHSQDRLHQAHICGGRPNM